MSTVYYTPIDENTPDEIVSKIARNLFETLVREENISLQKEIPIKVHFGEHGNKTFIPATAYHDLIECLKEKGIASSFIETTVLYNGKRHTKELLLQTSKDHGFDALPVISADGQVGEEFDNIEIDKTYFKSCKIGKAFSKYPQMIVCSHFKGHQMAGFGGAIKQLSMGFASKGGKLEMHMGIKPFIKEKKCQKCHICQTRCNYDAITINDNVSRIDHKKCVGCGACFASCPYKAISIYSIKGVLKALFQGNKFKEKLAEYAYAGQKGKQIIYLNFAKNITKGCDCEPRKMPFILPSFGVFASSDAVAIDKACFDMAKEKGKTFKGLEQLTYAEEIGLGSTEYTLQKVDF
ncbi:MAG: DUF362 domain-containing protein [Alphaproteobacteria bacterium]|nr:DUF362 domain-containing protein [Alphaproteobacteria bacterium]